MGIPALQKERGNARNRAWVDAARLRSWSSFWGPGTHMRQNVTAHRRDPGEN